MFKKLLFSICLFFIWFTNAQTFNDDVLEYTVIDTDNNYVSVEKYNFICPVGDLIIPNTIENEDITYTVTSIGEYGFNRCSSLTNISIPEGVTNISRGAFKSCTSLKSITIPESVVSIGYDVLSNCNGLSSIKLNWDVPLNINYSVFDELEIYDIALIVPEGTKNAYQSANVWRDFEKISSALPFNDGILEYTITDTLNKYVSVSKYNNICAAGAIVIPETVVINGLTYSITAIGDSAFYNCSDLTQITIPESITSIGKRAFLNCTGLTQISLPKNLTSIGRSAFWYCTGLTQIIIPESVTSIKEKAFYNCSNLVSINIPEGITSLDNNTFNTCLNLESIVLPENLTSIAYEAFENCTKLTSINIPDSVTVISSAAFGNCTALKEVIVNWMTPLYMSSYSPAFSDLLIDEILY